MSLATPEQLASVLDLDLWRAGQPGRDEQFDAARFGEWIEVLADLDAAASAQTLVAMEVHLVIAGFAEHVRVFDPATVAPDSTSKREDAEVGDYLLVPKRTEAWDAMVTVLRALNEEQPACFDQVMRGCRALSNSAPEIDGLDNLLTAREQVLYELAVDREERRDKQGYVTPAHARAFLQMSRTLAVVDQTPAAKKGTALSRRLPTEPGEELAYLANTMMAGCSIQSRPFTAREASEAAAAVCKLGLENRPADWPAGYSLVSLFQVGWNVLYEQVSLYAAKQLIKVLTELQSADRETQAALTRLRIEMKKGVKAGAPWRARDALDVIAILDTPAWSALLGLIDECPVMAAALNARIAGTLAVSASDFTFISENSQVASVRAFMQSLPDILR